MLKNDLLWVVPQKNLLCLKNFRFDFFRKVNTKGAHHADGFRDIYRTLDISRPSTNNAHDYSVDLAEKGFVVVLLSGKDEKLEKPLVLGIFRPDELSEKQEKFLDDITPFLNEEYDTSIYQTVICKENEQYKKINN